MIQIRIESLGKKFNREWIFRHLNYEFSSNNSYAITGPNGSGKSTLLQVISGIMPSTEGSLSYLQDNKQIHSDDIYKYISIATPYQELIEEMTLNELLSFHLKFQSFREEITVKEFLIKTKLEKSGNKTIQHFSSGMKQRVKLALALYSSSKILFLDEPTSNLDQQGIDWYLSEIKTSLKNRVTIICSNQSYEYDFCNSIIDLRK